MIRFRSITFALGILLVGCVAAKAQEISGKDLDAQFTKEGLGDKLYIEITKGELAQTFVSPSGAKLRLDAKRRWAVPVSLREFDAGGIAAYSIEAMVAVTSASGENRGMVAVLPMGGGTIYEIFGKVKLLGHTISADGATPLVFVVHRTSNANDTDVVFETSGPLAEIKFKFEGDSVEQPATTDTNVLLQLVHIGGIGHATLKDGKQITFEQVECPA